MFSPKNSKSSYIVKHSKKNKVKEETNTIEDKNENGRIYNKKFCNCCIII